jgi:hypothetical protein
MLIARILALFSGKSATPPKSTFEEMREALKPDKVHALPPRPLTATRIRKRT